MSYMKCTTIAELSRMSTTETAPICCDRKIVRPNTKTTPISSHNLSDLLQWGQSKSVEPAEWPRFSFKKPSLSQEFEGFPWDNSKTQSSLHLLKSRPPKFIVFKGLRGMGSQLPVTEATT